MKRFFITVSLLLIMVINTAGLYAQIKTAKSGNWSDKATWAGGAIPTAADNAKISAGHTITVDLKTAECNNLAFTDSTSRTALAQGSVLTLNGNLTLAGSAFASWADDAVLVFSGAADQLIENLSVLQDNTFNNQTFFRKVEIRKSAGKVYTQATVDTDVKFNLENSLDIYSGTFELGQKDDINGRAFNSTNSAAPVIIVRTQGTFKMLGGASQIAARQAGAIAANPKIGKATVYGKMYLTSSSSNKVNFDNIDIENGGTLYLDNGWSTGYFSPGNITIKNGGRISNSGTTNLWAAGSSVDINEGGTYESSSSTTPLPPSLINKGTFRYSRSITASNDQTIADIDYKNLRISYTNPTGGTGSVPTKKLWKLSADRTISDSLIIDNSAIFELSADSQKKLVIGKNLRLSTGNFNIDNSNINVELSADAEISRATGTMSKTPSFAGKINIKYTSVSEDIITGPELPASQSVINSFTMAGTKQVTLDKNITVNGTLDISSGILNNSTLLLTIANGAKIRRDAGILSALPVFAGKADLEYYSDTMSVTTDMEMPKTQNVLNGLSIKGAMSVQLSSDIYINGNLSLTGSQLITGTKKVILNPGSSLTENPGKVVFGKIYAERTLSKGINETFGGIGLEINAGTTAPGLTKVLRTNDGDNKVYGIKRHFSITPAINTNLNANVVFKYDDSEINNLKESKLAIYKSTDNELTWTQVGGKIDTLNNTITAGSIQSLSCLTLNEATGVGVKYETPSSLPDKFSLIQNYPNPFNPETNIKFTVEQNGKASLKIYDLLGNEIRELFNSPAVKGVQYTAVFNAKELPSGVYFAVLSSGNKTNCIKMLLQK